MNYKIVEKYNTFDVFEKATESVISSFSDKEEARKFLRFLNLGGAFDSWTPNFFLKSMKPFMKEVVE